MSTESNVYVGPYLVVSARIVEHRVDRCREPENCPNEQGKFCSKCGVDLTKRFVMEERFVHNPYDIAHEYGFMVVDAMSDAPKENVDPEIRSCVLLPNDTSFYSRYKRTMKVPLFESLAEDWRCLSPEVEMRDFDALYVEKILAILRAGYESVETRWGLVQWCS